MITGIGNNINNLDLVLKTEKYDDVSGVREHIMKLLNCYNDLKDLKV